MQRRAHSLSSLLLLALCAALAQSANAADRTYTEKSADGGQLRYEGEVPVLYLQGTPAEMGRQQAVLVTADVRPLLSIPRQLLADHGVGVAWPLIVQGARQMFSAAPPRYREELEAACKVAGFTDDDLGTLYVANAMVELRRIGGCSGLVVMPIRSASGEILFGRNLDFPNVSSMGRLGLVSVYRPAGKHALVAVGFPGLVGVISGMNEKGLCLATFDSYAAKDKSVMFNPLGVPFALLNRQVLEECATVEEARKLLASSKRTTMMSLMICDRKEAAVFELTPKTVAIRKPETEVLICTNHFLTPELSVKRDCWRYAKLEEYRRNHAKLAREQLAEALHAVNQGDLTLQTMIFEPQAMRMHVSLGSPPSSAHPLQELDLTKLLAHAREQVEE
jgi:isopenicillin-N N-acyltransferase like protein